MYASASYPIIVFGDDWGRHVSSMQHVFREIVTQRDVIWVNGIGHRIPQFRLGDLRRVWEKGQEMIKPQGPSIDFNPDGPAPRIIVRPRVLPWHHRSGISTLNRWSLSHSVQDALQRLGVPHAPIVVTGTPPSAPLIGRLGELASIYFCMDDFLHLAGTTPHMLKAFEGRLLNSVDAVVATAKALTLSKVPKSGQVHYLPQGVMYEHFATAQTAPPELGGLPRPLIGFSGGVSACCDLKLLQRVADSYPNASVVLVGPVTVDTSELDRPNIHLLGSRSYQELPAYVQQFDVGLIPYVRNEWTAAVDPLKLLEYLAAGIPVVSTAIPEVDKYRDTIRIGADHESFLQGLSFALAADPIAEKTRGQALARENTWAERARRFLGILDEFAEQRRVSRVGHQR